MLAPHESSQAHREHIRTSGFYLPFLFFFCSCKESTGRQVCQVPQDHHAHVPKKLRVCILPIYVVGFHIPGSPLKRYGKGRFFWQEPAGIRGFLKEAFPRERSLTCTRAAKAERTALHAKAKNSSAAENEMRLKRRCIRRYHAVIEMDRNVGFLCQDMKISCIRP